MLALPTFLLSLSENCMLKIELIWSSSVQVFHESFNETVCLINVVFGCDIALGRLLFIFKHLQKIHIKRPVGI